MQSRVLQRLAAVGILIILLGPSLVGQNAVTDWNNIAITAARASSKPGRSVSRRGDPLRRLCRIGGLQRRQFHQARV